MFRHDEQATTPIREFHEPPRPNVLLRRCRLATERARPDGGRDRQVLERWTVRLHLLDDQWSQLSGQPCHAVP
jgi:hypothetical protein